MSSDHPGPEQPTSGGPPPASLPPPTDHQPPTYGQLSLALDVARPALPGELQPMLPRRWPEPFDDQDCLFEPWWGGLRAFLVVEQAPGPGEPPGPRDAPGPTPTVRIVAGRHADVGRLLPELTGPGGAVERLAGHSAIVDGCLVVIRSGGQSDEAALAARLRGGPGPSVAFLAFDLVALDGRMLIAEPLERRRDRLRKSVRPGGGVLVVPAIPVEGRALHAAASAQGVPAIIGRHRQSPYLPGVRSRLWRLVQTERPSTATVLGPEAAASAPAPATAPILALIQRLPFDDWQ